MGSKNEKLTIYWFIISKSQGKVWDMAEMERIMISEKGINQEFQNYLILWIMY